MKPVNELLERLSSETPTWFKTIAWYAAAIAVVTGALLLANGSGTITLNDWETEWLNRIGIAASAVSGVAVTAKKDTNSENSPNNNNNGTY